MTVPITGAAFLDPLDLEYIDGRHWRVIKQFRYRTKDDWVITVPTDFVTDFASIPRGLWNIFPPTTSCGQASVVHDWIYTSQPCTRAKADGVLREAMEVIGAKRLTRWLVYAGVRAGGHFIWQRHTDDLNEASRRLAALAADGDDAA